MRCKNCNIQGVKGLQRDADGSIHIIERCPKCHERTGDKFFYSKKDNPEWEAYPVLVDYSEYSEPCSVRGCTNKNTQYHHFAPRHIFEDADNWPTAYLCMEHHLLWHKLTKTGMYALKKKVHNGNHRA